MIGTILVLLLLEASRRVIGPALPIIALFFTAYAFMGPHLPDLFAFKGVSIRKYLGNITLSTEGIYGIPLGVSASIVYLFVLLGALLDKAEQELKRQYFNKGKYAVEIKTTLTPLDRHLQNGAALDTVVEICPRVLLMIHQRGDHQRQQHQQSGINFRRPG